MGIVVLDVSGLFGGIVHDCLQDLVQNGANGRVLCRERLEISMQIAFVPHQKVDNIEASGVISLATKDWVLCSTHTLLNIPFRSQAVKS